LKDKENEHNLVLKDKDLEMKDKEKDLIVEMNNKNNEIMHLNMSILRLKNRVTVRGGLEHIRHLHTVLNSGKAGNLKLKATEDAVLKAIASDPNFSVAIDETASANGVRPDDLIRATGGLYHTTSKHFHGAPSSSGVVIDGRDFSYSEVIALGILFSNYKIAFEYVTPDGVYVRYPYPIHLKPNTKPDTSCILFDPVNYASYSSALNSKPQTTSTTAGST
jgi:hypothetical protein